MEPSPSSLPRKRGRPRKDKPKEEERETETERETEEATATPTPTTPTTTTAAEKMRDRVEKKPQSSNIDDKYTHWKSLVPILYDWLANHNLVWPSLSCRWGPQLEHGKFKNRQRLYLSEQTDGSVPNTLVIANCDVVKSRVAAAEHIAQFNEEARSPFVRKYKTIIHPGEVNRIRELPQNNNIVATHTDCPEVLIWDVEAQPNRHAVLGAADSRPDLVLTGHQENAEFALAMCPTEPLVLSGGKDKSVVLWSIHDHVSTLASDPSTKPTGSAGSIIKTTDNISIGPRGIFQGHEDTVEDVQFCPSSAQEFCSVGDDSCLILWDARVGTSPVFKVEKAHDADLHCVDWNPHDENLIITGSADNSVCMFDRRNLTSDGAGLPVHKFESHKAAVLCVQWSPDRSSVFGSSAEDGFLNIWDYEKVGKKNENGARTPNSCSGLFFQHAGHRDKVVDFHWNAADPWTVVSVSDDCDTSGGGGTLQIWRMNDLIYRPEEDALAELEKFKSHVVDCASKS
ncbi:WD-40 repeat-containing protein MSI4-like [Camellia sinensis]|uniref:WD-40 repeat-containing protein MSI4-like n=1 Tax=Camellia sinensis TaxID=4442 RepID=UPI001036E010|nr:WD-40 repeat-containing protein MSI4-like [Camellia sinensis]